MSRVKDNDKYWTDPPPEPSDNCTAWATKIKAGWRPNRRISRMGYEESAEFYGVYYWEYLNVLSPMLYGGPTLAQSRSAVREALGLSSEPVRAHAVAVDV